MIGRKVAAVLLGVLTGAVLDAIWLLIDIGPCRTPILRIWLCSTTLGPPDVGFDLYVGLPVAVGIGIVGWWEVLVKDRR